MVPSFVEVARSVSNYARRKYTPYAQIAPSKLADFSSRDGGLLISHCAQLSHPPTHWHAETCP
jgi:hypothetical protein